MQCTSVVRKQNFVYLHILCLKKDTKLYAGKYSPSLLVSSKLKAGLIFSNYLSFNTIVSEQI